MEDEKQVVREELIFAEVRRKERLYQTVKQTPFQPPFMVLSGLCLCAVIYAAYSFANSEEAETVLLVAIPILLLAQIFNAIHTQKKIDALLELLGDEKLREIDRDRIGIEPFEG